MLWMILKQPIYPMKVVDIFSHVLIALFWFRQGLIIYFKSNHHFLAVAEKAVEQILRLSKNDK